MKKVLILFGLIAVVLIAGCTSPTGQVISDTSGSGEASTYQPSCREISEQYQEEEPYTTYLTAQIISATASTDWDLQKGYYREGLVKLKNTDVEEGWFTVTFNWKTLKDTATDTIRHHVEPDETIDFLSIYDIDMGEDNTYTYSYVSDPITKTKWTTKTRTRTVCD